MSRSVARCIALLLVALAATVAFAGCGGGGSSSLGTGIVANVNGVEISQTELDEVVSQATDRLEAQGQKLPAAGSEQYQAIQQDALQYLVKKIQLEQQAKELGVTVTDKQVDERLQSAIKQFFAGSEKKYRQSLKKQKLTDARVREELRSSLLADAIFKKVSSSAKVSDAEIEAYYRTHADVYQQKESRQIAHILVKSKALANSIYSQLQNGGDFAKLAQKYSIDSSKSVGGKMTIQKGEAVPPFEKAAFALKTKAISKPVHTRFGWHVITALGPLEQAKTTSLADAKASIRQTLQSTAQSNAVSVWLNQLNQKYADKIKYATGFAPPSTTATSTG